MVVLPLKQQAAIAIGRVTGSYQYRTDLHSSNHTLPVQWIKKDIPRTQFQQDLLYSFGAFMTVCQIQRNQAEARVAKIVQGRHADKCTINAPIGDEELITEEALDVEQNAEDQILAHINRNFKGHDLTTLVDEILKAEGFVTHPSDPGPDGGVDILVGSGPMGFDAPRICVQVKSSDTTADVVVFRNLLGTLDAFGATQGLLVSWGGFNRAVLTEARRNFFKVRLWDAGDLIEALQRNYPRLPGWLKAELPLKQIWAMVLEDD
ncbi:restriction endonuclease [Sporosarcina sp. NCCP-2716]|nr:restriction endonuclease [Sporosarcina sp. NCCP-2716]